MADLDKKRDFVVVVEDLEKTITMDSHLAAVLDVNTLGPAHQIGDNQTPMLKITYEELDLNGIEAAYKNDQRLLPLRNLLVGKKKGLDKSQCAFGLYCVPDVDDENTLFYYLKVEKNLFDRVDENNKQRPEIFAKIKISGLAQESVSLETGFGFQDRTFECNYEDTKSTIRFVKKRLKNPEGEQIITFQFTISIECTPRWDYDGLVSSKTLLILQDMLDLPDSTKDVTIVASNGAEIKAHKIVLMVQSAAFLSMLSSENSTAESQSGKILMDGNSEEGLTQFLRYLYGFTINVEDLSSDLALEVFQLSHKYGVKELEGDLKNLLTERGLDWYSVDSILELYFYVKNNKDLEEIRAHALTELSGISQEDLMASAFFQNLDETERINLLFTLWNWSRIKI